MSLHISLLLGRQLSYAFFLALLIQLLVAFGHNLFTSAFFTGVNNFLSPPFAHSQTLAHREHHRYMNAYTHTHTFTHTVYFSKEKVVNSVS